jgi:hypothetical protein
LAPRPRPPPAEYPPPKVDRQQVEQAISRMMGRGTAPLTKAVRTLTEPAGDEALRLVLEPCSSPELVAATRNIVKVTDTGSGSDLHLGACQASTAPAAAVGARNIVKATMDGNTGFALDPVSGQELASGRLASRETTIAIHHR